MSYSKRHDVIATYMFTKACIGYTQGQPKIENKSLQKVMEYRIFVSFSFHFILHTLCKRINGVYVIYKNVYKTLFLQKIQAQ